MNLHVADPMTDRLFRHMAWANTQVIHALSEIDPEQWTLAAPQSEWSVAAIVQHMASSAGFYVIRLDASATTPELPVPVDRIQMSKIGTSLAITDARLRELAGLSEEIATYVREGKEVRRARSTILAQSLHHATEHRAQIAGILSAHAITAIDLDELDLWAFGDSEGKGE